MVVEEEQEEEEESTLPRATCAWQKTEWWQQQLQQHSRCHTSNGRGKDAEATDWLDWFLDGGYSTEYRLSPLTS